jgi:hypothetical protein
VKTCKDYTFCRESYGRHFWNTHGLLFVAFLIEQRTINAAYYSKLLKDRVKPAFRSKRRGQSVRSVCLLHDNACPHTAAMTTGTLDEMHREVLPHPSLVLTRRQASVTCSVHSKGARRKRFRANDEVTLLLR